MRGGVGVGGAVFINTTSYIAGSQIITTATIGKYVTASSTGTTSTFTVLNTTNSTSTTTGALVVRGGVGVGGDLYIGGTIYGTATTATTANTATSFVVSSVSSNNTRYLAFVSINSGYATAETSATSLIYVANRGLAIGTSTFTTVADPMSFTGNFSSGKVLDIYGALYLRQVPNIAPGNYLGQGVYNGTTYINAGGALNSFVWQINGSQKMFLSTSSYLGIGNQPISDFHLHGAEFRHNDVNGWNTYTFKILPGAVQFASTSSLSITNRASSISTITGALVVGGGVGIGGDLYVGGNIVSNKLTIQLTTVTTTNVVTDDIISTYNTTQASSTSSGALQVVGGVGIGGNLYVGRLSANTGTNIVYYNTSTGELSYGLFTGGVPASISFDGTRVISITNPTTSTNALNGALVVTGGVGVQGNIYSAGRIGWTAYNNPSVSAVYQFYNPVTQSLDTIFG